MLFFSVGLQKQTDSPCFNEYYIPVANRQHAWQIHPVVSTGGRKESEGGRDAITWSRRPVCGNSEPRPEGKEDGVMQRWWGLFLAVGQQRSRLGPEVWYVSARRCALECSEQGRVEGGEVRKDSSGEITCFFVDFEEESGFLWSVLKIRLNWFFKNPSYVCMCSFEGLGAGWCPQEQEELSNERPGTLCPKSQLKETVLKKGRAMGQMFPLLFLHSLKAFCICPDFQMVSFSPSRNCCMH